MSDDKSGSASALPGGSYTVGGTSSYNPSLPTETTSVAAPPSEAVHFVAGSQRATVQFDPQAHATRKLIRRLNEA
jgi:hypothetical protein